MASGVMTEAILIIASIVVATSVAGIVMSKVGSFESTFTATSENQKNIMLTKLTIPYAIQNKTSTNIVEVWVKNIGIDPIINPASMDVYFGKVGSVKRYQYNSTSAIDDTWQFKTLPTIIQKTDAVQIRITEVNPGLSAGTYMIRITAPNGVYADYIFSIS
jgi:flagellar protein FlaG